MFSRFLSLAIAKERVLELVSCIWAWMPPDWEKSCSFWRISPFIIHPGFSTVKTKLKHLFWMSGFSSTLTSASLGRPIDPAAAGALLWPPKMLDCSFYFAMAFSIASFFSWAFCSLFISSILRLFRSSCFSDASLPSLSWLMSNCFRFAVSWNP